MPIDPTLIALDVGGTKIRGGIVSGSRATDIVTVPSPSRVSAAAMVEAIAAVAQRLRTKAPSAAGLAVATAGVVDPETGTILSATDSINGWAGVALGHALAEQIHLPVHVANDAVAFTVGEARYGAGRHDSRVLGITVGTGIGGAMTVDGLPQSGPEIDNLLAGLLAMEGHASGRGIEARYLRATGTAISVKDLDDRGDALGTELIHKAATALRTGIQHAADQMRAELVVLGGSIAEHVPAIRNVLTDLTLPASVPIVLAVDPDRAPLLGMAELWQHSRKDGR